MRRRNGGSEGIALMKRAAPQDKQQQPRMIAILKRNSRCCMRTWLGKLPPGGSRLAASPGLLPLSTLPRARLLLPCVAL